MNALTKLISGFQQTLLNFRNLIHYNVRLILNIQSFPSFTITRPLLTNKPHTYVKKCDLQEEK